MSSVGYPDWQKITQWLGAPLVEATALPIGAGVQDDGPFNLASWASVVLAIKPAGGAVTVTIKQMVSGGPASLELDTTFIVPAGQAVFEAVVLLGDAVSLHLAGGVVGTTVDYALYPSNTTTNSQAVTGSNVLIPVVVLAAFPPANPVDGQAVLLELPASYDPVGAKKVRWLCTYDAATAMWDVAGPPLYAEVLTSEQQAATGLATYQALTTPGPSITLPRPGDYAVTVGANGLTINIANAGSWMSYDVGATGAIDDDGAGFANNTNNPVGASRTRELAGLAAVTLTAKYRLTVGTATDRFQDRYLSVHPVRIT